LAKSEWFTPVCEVHAGEALGMLSTLELVHQLHLGSIDFELNAKKVVNSFSSARWDVTKFEIIIHNGKTIFEQYYVNSSVEFVRRQASEATHRLVISARNQLNIIYILGTLITCFTSYLMKSSKVIDKCYFMFFLCLIPTNYVGICLPNDLKIKESEENQMLSSWLSHQSVAKLENQMLSPWPRRACNGVIAKQVRKHGKSEEKKGRGRASMSSPQRAKAV
jgi:hypothetical protein